MLIDIALELEEIETAAEQARAAEAAGYAGFVASETKYDAFLPIVQAAAATEDIALSTGIAIAFARNPMNLAHLGYDLQRISGGRFTLGLGSQIKPHIESRYSMPWGKPATRMRDMLTAMRAIWANWEHGTPLAHRGEYYKHTLMTPMFTPARHEYGAPPIRLAAVGAGMTAVAGELADGLICHPFTSPTFIREVTVPAVTAGAASVGRDLSGFEYSGMAMIGLAVDEQERERSAAALRKQIAFYASTPAYRGVLEIHGWGELQPRLNELSKRGEWDAMGGLITDEMLATYAFLGTPEEVARQIDGRYGSVLSRMSVYTPHTPAPGLVEEFVAHNNTRSDVR